MAPKISHRARQAFLKNGFIMIVDDRQVTDLEDPINLCRDSTATFIRLMPLQGG